MSGLSTHALDSACGVSAAGVRAEPFRPAPGDGRERATASTANADGRAGAPLPPVAEFRRGTDGPVFLDEITPRFGIADEGAHRHVPPLVSPWSHATHRGS